MAGRAPAAATLLVAVLCGCLLNPGSGGRPPPVEETTPADAYRIETVATGLGTPWALAFSPDGRIFVTERAGRVRVIDPDGNLQTELWATPAAAEESESGLMGIALDPDFPNPAHVYLHYTYRTPGGSLENKIVRWTERDGRGTAETTLLAGIPAASLHDGGRLKFGPDGLLYATAGDARTETHAQNPSSLAGKILRINRDGSIPGTNPDPASPVYSHGHRNPQGLCWNPANGWLYSTEHGPNTDDEVNVIEAGKNYGWPLHRGTDSAPGFEAAIASWTPTIAPAGCAFYEDSLRARPAWDGNLLFVTLAQRDLRRLVLDPRDPRSVAGEEVLLDEEYGRLRDVALSPAGHVYLTTSNRDGRGGPDPEDDRVLRLVFG